ncbi:hypothetical protein [Haloplanus salinarum]|nr:hypothetical protein [Haloplanus salinarum]
MSVALNIGANSSSPGGRGPIYGDGTFRYIPIPEDDETVNEPTYDDLGLGSIRPESAKNTVTHFDPEFPEIGYNKDYSYGDRHSPKTNRIAELEEGDILFFYATLDYVGEGNPEQDWINDDWGAYIIGHFTLEYDPIPKDEYHSLPEDVKEKFVTNAHVRRDEFDAEYLVLGNPDDSRLYKTPVPLSGESGVEANQFVTKHSEDSGGGPWYRRPLKFDTESTRAVLRAQRDYHSQRIAEPDVESATEFNRTQLGEKGQLQWFFHSPHSEYPVRDIVNRGKTEPYIEKGAENFCSQCYQNSIKTFAETASRRYLFLFTRCQNESLYEHDNRRIVGYIDKKRALNMGDRVAVQGDTTLVSFEDSVDLVGLVDSPKYVRNAILDKEIAQRLVEYFDEQENILDDCLDEVERLKRKRRESEHGDVAVPTSPSGC